MRLAGYAAELGLDGETFLRTIDDEDTYARVHSEVTSAEASGARGTPTSFVNGRRHRGPHHAQSLTAAGGTDVLFALDSIPAIFGRTQSTFVVFTATAFSLLGLRVKLILHALHENNLGIVNDGQPFHVVEVTTGLSLAVILGVLVVTIVASLLSPSGRAQSAIADARRHATSYLDSEYTADPDERERIFRLLLAERDQIVAMGPVHRQKVRDEPELMALLELCPRQSRRGRHALGLARAAGAPGIIDPR